MIGKWKSSGVALLIMGGLLLVAGLAGAYNTRGRRSPQPLTKPTAGNFNFPIRTGNIASMVDYYGGIGEPTNMSPEAPSMEWPTGSDNHYLYAGSWQFLGYKFDGSDWILTGTGNRDPLPGYERGFRSNAESPDPDRPMEPLPQGVTPIATTEFWAGWTDYGPLKSQDVDTPPDPEINPKALNIQTLVKIYAWSESYRDDFIVWDFTIKNVDERPDLSSDERTLKGFYLGNWMDCDVSSWGVTNFWIDDLVSFYGDEPEEWDPLGKKWLTVDPADSIFIGYEWDADDPGISGDDTGGALTPKESPGVIGTITVAASPTNDGLVNQPAGFSWWDWNTDPKSSQELYDVYMRWRDAHPSEPYRSTPPNPFDFRYFISWGPYDIAPGDSIRLILAIGIGPGVEGMVNNLSIAKVLYKNNWIGPDAPPSPSLTVTAGDNQITLEWGDTPEYQTSDAVTKENDFQGYRVWKRPATDPNWTLLLQVDQIDDVGMNTGLVHKFVDYAVLNGFDYVYAVTSFDRGDPTIGLEPLESGRSANKTTITPSPKPAAGGDLSKVEVVPNPYTGHARWNPQPSKRTPPSDRLAFINLPPKCNIYIYTLAGDLVDKMEWKDNPQLVQGGMAFWDAIQKEGIRIVSSLYIAVVEETETGKTQVLKFVVIN